MPKKHIEIGYNKLVDEYNYIAICANSANYEVAQTNAKIKAYKKRMAELKGEQAKLLEMCQKVYKPDNYDYCIYLWNRRNQLIAQLDATKLINTYELKPERETKTETHSSTTYTTHTTTGPNGTMITYSVPSTTTTTETYETGIRNNKEVLTVKHIPDEEKRQNARNELPHIEDEISKQGNFEYNLALKRLYNSYDNLTTIIDCLPQIIAEEKQKIKIAKKKLVKFNLLRKELGDVIEDEKMLISSNCDISKLSLKEKNEFYCEPKIKIEDVDIAYYLTEEHFKLAGDYSIKKWRKTVNEQIEAFGVDYIENNDFSKLPNDDYCCKLGLADFSDDETPSSCIDIF